jgi:hypothetical protein
MYHANVLAKQNYAEVRGAYFVWCMHAYVCLG